MDDEISQLGAAAVFLLGGALFVGFGLLASRILAPSRPNPEKNSTYECGEEPIGTARIQLNPRFYAIALVFLVFDVEVLFLFPWAMVFADKPSIIEAYSWGWFALGEMFVFTLILLAGLAYAWKKGDLDWVKPSPISPDRVGEVPFEAYEAFNQKQTHGIKPKNG